MGHHERGHEICSSAPDASEKDDAFMIEDELQNNDKSISGNDDEDNQISNINTKGSFLSKKEDATSEQKPDSSASCVHAQKEQLQMPTMQCEINVVRRSCVLQGKDYNGRDRNIATTCSNFGTLQRGEHKTTIIMKQIEKEEDEICDKNHRGDHILQQEDQEEEEEGKEEEVPKPKSPQFHHEFTHVLCVGMPKTFNSRHVNGTCFVGGFEETSTQLGRWKFLNH